MLPTPVSRQTFQAYCPEHHVGGGILLLTDRFSVRPTVPHSLPLFRSSPSIFPRRRPPLILSPLLSREIALAVQDATPPVPLQDENRKRRLRLFFLSSGDSRFTSQCAGDPDHFLGFLMTNFGFV